MGKSTFVDLCKKVRSTWPKEEYKFIDKALIVQVSILSAYPALARFLSSPKKKCEKKPMAKSLSHKEVQGETANVHRCSLDSKHHHLMIHGEALARRHMAKKQVFACNPREQEVANIHLRRLEVMQVCLRHRYIVQVNLEEKPVDYSNPVGEVDRHFIITRVMNFSR